MASIYMRAAQPADLDRIMAIITEAQALLKADGSTQWQDGYPDREIMGADIDQHHCFVLMVDGQIAGTATLITGAEPNYAVIEDGHWADETHPYATIHRFALSADFRGMHLSQIFFSNLLSHAYNDGVRHFRIDTHEVNLRMQHIIKSFGYDYRGIIYVDDTPTGKRVAFELALP
ncbi:GNAT family N-acetyltransferase [Levilactobacillus tangyuanensis]|uniref:GNAT family N-acetyltransferase n=1 Tax=Levilactobacillus tangyuanensis TaxID=2486021 RepID=A0ABW1TQ63_9LACO|nr:GNAT family N-acetyltransferase [Levilactobacillus tangyuanensis]